MKVGRVYFLAESDLSERNRAAAVRGMVRELGKDSDVWIVAEGSWGDFMVTAVHEAAHIRGVPDNTQELVQLVYDAWIQLTPSDRDEAAHAAHWLFEMTRGQVGRQWRNPPKE